MEDECSKPTPEALEQQAQQSDQSWKSRLETGKRQASNLAMNLEFLKQTGLLRCGQKILEVGCGIGTLVHELTQQGHSVIGTWISYVEVVDNTLFARECLFSSIPDNSIIENDLYLSFSLDIFP